jgi:hypothetical protein
LALPICKKPKGEGATLNQITKFKKDRKQKEMSLLISLLLLRKASIGL